MEELKQLLLQTDEEYLIGISNKGIVKRACKDLETENPKIEWVDQEAKIELKDSVCRIRVPLAESSCSCPSRSICRHLITAILYAREKAKEGCKEAEKSVDEQKEKLKAEILEYPRKKLERFGKTREYRLFLTHLQAGELPVIQEGSIFTISFPWESSVVKLLSPLEFSTCSCHSRELCIHKAQAILAFWLAVGKISLDELKGLAEFEESWDKQEIGEAAASMKEAIQLQLGIGLSRLSKEAQESMERLAIISRGVRLPNFENEFRKAASEYRMYRERKAAFRAGKLMERLLELYHKACRLEQAKEASEIRHLAGVFRDSYEPVGRLHLVTMGQRFFNSKTGYEGEIYYFLEINQKKFYSWTDVRPVFYEGKTGKSAAAYTRQTVPWELNCSREELKQLEFYLDTAKATKDNRLSVSRETRGEIVGKRELKEKELETLIFWDYAPLLDDWDAKGDQLILAGAREIGEAVFDTAEQKFSMELLDEEGRVLLAAVNYSKEEQLTIRFLERLSKRMKDRGGEQLVFLGRTYLEKGQLCLYPVEYFTAEELGIEERGGGRKKEEKEKQIRTDCYRKAIERAEDYLESVGNLLEDLFVCGLDSVQENLLKEMKRMGEEGEQLGLYHIVHRLYFLQKELDGRRHGAKPCMQELFLAWAYLSACLRLCRKKTAYDLALVTMEKGC